MDTQLLTVGEVAEFFKVNTRTIYRWLERKKRPKLKAVRIHGPTGHTIRIKLSDLNKFVEESSQEVN